jgi:hypothetical protein
VLGADVEVLLAAGGYVFGGHRKRNHRLYTAVPSRDFTDLEEVLSADLADWADIAPLN